MDTREDDNLPFHMQRNRYKTIFTNLSSVVVGALFQQEKSRWSCAEKMTDQEDIFSEGRANFTHFLNAHPNIESLCHTGEGPISYRCSSLRDRIAATSLNCHSKGGNFPIDGGHDLASGISTRMYVHSWPTLGHLDVDLIVNLHWQFASLKTDRRLDSDGTEPSMPDLDWGMYIGPKDGNSPLIKDEEARIVDAEIIDIKAEVSKVERRTQPTDEDFKAVKWEIEPLSKAPKCEACTWQPARWWVIMIILALTLWLFD